MKCLQSMRHRETRPARPASCAAILVHCSIRDWARFSCASSDSKIARFIRSQVIGFLSDQFFFSTLEADLKISGFALAFAERVCTDAVSGKKKLRIQKHPDICGRVLRIRIFLNPLGFLSGFKNFPVQTLLD